MRGRENFVAFEEKRFEKRKNVLDTMAADLCASEWSSWNCLDGLALAEEEKERGGVKSLIIEGEIWNPSPPPKT